MKLIHSFQMFYRYAKPLPIFMNYRYKLRDFLKICKVEGLKMKHNRFAKFVCFVLCAAVMLTSTVFAESNWPGEKNNPIISVECPEVTLIENTNGIQMGDYYYYNHFYNNFNGVIYTKCILEYQDGERIHKWATVSKSDLDKQKNHHWTVGNTYYVDTEYSGISGKLKVTIVDNPIKAIEIGDITVEESDINQYSLTNYVPQYKVTLKNGEVLISDSDAGEDNYVEIYGTKYPLTITNFDEFDNRNMKAGNSYDIKANVAGVPAEFKINVIEDSINIFKKLTIDDFTVYKSVDSDYYDFSPRSGTAELITGEKISFKGFNILAYGKSYHIDYKTPSKYESGNTYEIDASIGDCKTTYKVTIPDAYTKASVTDFKLVKLPTKTEYITGECFDLRGAILGFTFSDGDYEEIKVTDFLYGYELDIYELFSEKLQSSFKLEVGNYNKYGFNGYSPIDSPDTSNIILKALDKTVSCPISVQKNDWKSVEIINYNTLSPKIRITKNDGTVFLLDCIYAPTFGDVGGGDPWVNSRGYRSRIFTDKGIYAANLFCWSENDCLYFYYYFDNYRIKSNKIIKNDYKVFGVGSYIDAIDKICHSARIQYRLKRTVRLNADESFLIEFISPEDSTGVAYSGVNYNVYSGDYIRSIFEKNGRFANLTALKNYDPLTDTYKLYYDNSYLYYEEVSLPQIKYIDGMYYVEQEGKMGTVVYMRLDDDLNILGYECGYAKGDIFGNDDNADGVTDSDVLYLLRHTFRPEKYPVNQLCDYNNDGKITDADAVYLLKHIYRPEKYPLS